MIAVHEHLGLDDRDEPGLLAERGVAREGVGVASMQRGVGGRRRSSITARHFVKRAPSHGTRQPLAEAVEALGHLLAGRERERLGARVDLDAGNRSLALEDLANGVPSSADWRIVSS